MVTTQPGGDHGPVVATLARATRATAPTAAQQRDLDYKELCGLLRDVLVEAQRLERATTTIDHHLACTDAALREPAVRTAVGDGVRVYGFSAGRISDRVAAVRALFDENAQLYTDYGDTLEGIEDDWTQIKDAWPRTNPAQTLDQIAATTRSIAPLLHHIVLRCGTVAIPERLNSRLETIRVGQTLDFSQEFADELPDAADRDAILAYLQAHPAEVNGIVVGADGLIYRASRGAHSQRMSALRVGVVVALGFVLAYLLTAVGHWLHLAHWPVSGNQLQSLVSVYAFLVLGACVHVLVDAYKQARSPGNAPLLVLGDWLLWINAKEAPIIWGVVSLWIGFLGLAWTNTFDWQVAFIAGYSIDSVADLYLKRFITTIQAGTTALVRQSTPMPIAPAAP